MRLILLGFLYFLVAFIAGFILGVFRSILVEPRLGTTAALLLEVPLILAICWAAAGFILTHGSSVTPSLQERGIVGATAFLLLVSAEFLLGLFFSYSPAEIFDQFSSGNGLIGLTAQVAFGLFPLLRRH